MMKETNSKVYLNISLYLRRLVTPILLASFCFIVIFTILLGPRPYKGGLQEGDIAKETIKAPFNFYVEGSIDEEATNLLREKAVDKIKDIYEIDNKKVDKSLYTISLFFDEIEKLKNDEELAEEGKIIALKEKTTIALKNHTLKFLFNLPEQEIEKIKATLKDSIKEVMNKPIVGLKEKGELEKKDKNLIIINPSRDIETETSVDSLLTLKEAKEYVQGLVNKKLKDKEARSVSTEIVNQVLKNNSVFDKKLTAQRKQKAKDAVLPIYRKIKISKSSIIIAKSQLITKEHISYLKKLQQMQHQEDSSIGKRYYYFSIGFFVIMLFFLFWLYLKLYQPDIFLNPRYLALIALLFIIIIVLTKVISLSSLSSYLIPLAAISMLIAILLNGSLAIVATVFLSIFVGIITGEQLSTFLYSLAGGLVGIYSVRNVRRRSQLLKAGLLVGVISSLTIIGIDLLHDLGLDIILNDSLWGIVNGLVCAFIVTGILPVLEYLFRITTNISLLELSDLNHSLLKEMVIKAPGTYHHSLIVGNLAENAADSIGANSLLARVGAYYHDIGKLIKPEYFSENQMGYKDKHAKLNPKMSNLIITNHIKEGIELAKKHKLNKAIIDFIQQHHGKSLTFYFYQRALENELKEGDAQEETFRYPGPLPQTKETAIVLLADSVEAATRAIVQPTSAKIKKTVQKIINNKFIDGQLDECDLSLKDLHKISESFSNLLVGIYHSRVEYPEENEKK